jgi:hypothetical protein
MKNANFHSQDIVLSHDTVGEQKDAGQPKNVTNPHVPGTKQRAFRGNRRPLLNNYGGFMVGTPVHLTGICVPSDHLAVIIGINSMGEFRVRLKSKEIRDANGPWCPIWAEELEHVSPVNNEVIDQPAESPTYEIPEKLRHIL